jgi:glutamine phosphoribosylpyrophosphate amidotransferase
MVLISLVLKNLFWGTLKEQSKKLKVLLPKKIGADSVRFISLNGLKEALGGKDKFCFACLDGKYPTKAGCEF